MASTYLTRTPSTAGNRKTWTYSAWVKRSELSGSNYPMLLDQRIDSNNRTGIFFGDAEDFYGLFSYASGSQNAFIRPAGVFRDLSAFYHFVVAVDTTQATASNRVKVWINGNLQTGLTNSDYPSLDADLEINNTGTISIGGGSGLTGFGGLMAHVHFIDGLAYDASAFGQFDANGIWTPNASPSVTYGTNGFFLDFADSTSMGNDVSGENNDFTVGGGDVTQTLDTPSDNFCTWNPLNQQSSISYSEGNTTFINSSSTNRMAFSNFGVEQGKWYSELKIGVVNDYMRLGIADISYYIPVTNAYSTNLPNSVSYANDNPVFIGGSSQGAFSTFTTNDIISIAMDMDNGFVYFRKNADAWINSGVPTSGATGTGGFAIPNYTTKTYCFLGSSFDGGTDNTVLANFGNGYFGTTEIVSPENDSAGLGKFAYAVPAGYYALNTKNLAEFG